MASASQRETALKEQKEPGGLGTAAWNGGLMVIYNRHLMVVNEDFINKELEYGIIMNYPLQ